MLVLRPVFTSSTFFCQPVRTTNDFLHISLLSPSVCEVCRFLWIFQYNRSIGLSNYSSAVNGFQANIFLLVTARAVAGPFNGFSQWDVFTISSVGTFRWFAFFMIHIIAVMFVYKLTCSARKVNDMQCILNLIMFFFAGAWFKLIVLDYCGTIWICCI